MKDEADNSILSSRTFALGLIGIASLYVLVMICQAYKTNMNGLHDEDDEEMYASEYEYVTESYDFAPYQSQENENASEARGFTYNQSIGNMSSVGSSME